MHALCIKSKKLSLNSNSAKKVSYSWFKAVTSHHVVKLCFWGDGLLWHHSLVSKHFWKTDSWKTLTVHSWKMGYARKYFLLYLANDKTKKKELEKNKRSKRIVEGRKDHNKVSWDRYHFIFWKLSEFTAVWVSPVSAYTCYLFKSYSPLDSYP